VTEGGAIHSDRAAEVSSGRSTHEHDQQLEMVTISHGSENPVLVNSYENGNIRHQTMVDGRAFDYRYSHDSQLPKGSVVPLLVTDPNGKVTHLRCDSSGCVRSLPSPPSN
jgi:hypothetical protein